MSRQRVKRFTASPRPVGRLCWLQARRLGAGRPLVGRIQGSKVHHLKELRPLPGLNLTGSGGETVRIQAWAGLAASRSIEVTTPPR